MKVLFLSTRINKDVILTMLNALEQNTHLIFAPLKTSSIQAQKIFENEGMDTIFDLCYGLTQTAWMIAVNSNPIKTFYSILLSLEESLQ